MVDGINRFALRELEDSPNSRAKYWHRDFQALRSERRAQSPASANASWASWTLACRPLGSSCSRPRLPARNSRTPRVTQSHAVRWNVLPGVTAEGLLLDPRQPPRARVIVLPDADWTPEAFAGLTSGVDPRSQLPRRLAENGVQVVVPTLISRDDKYSGNPDVRFTNQPHREFIYRMAFELGRHVIGYEVQKVLAAVDIFSRMNTDGRAQLPIARRRRRRGGACRLLCRRRRSADPGGAGQRILSASRAALAGTDLPECLVAVE